MVRASIANATAKPDATVTGARRQVPKRSSVTVVIVRLGCLDTS